MPLKAILGTLLGALTIKDVLGGIFQPIKHTLYDEVVEGGCKLLKWNMFKSFFHGLRQFAACFDDLAESDPDIVSGISGRGLIDIFDDLISFTLVLSALIGDELSEELLLELLQEGISNAIQTSIGGAFQTIMNVYRGGQPVYGDDIINVPRVWDNLDDKINAFNIASSGMNFPATVQYLSHGIKDKLDDTYRDAGHIMSALLIRAIDEEFWWLTTYLELARSNILSKIRYISDVSARYAELCVRGIESSISRLQDMLQEVSTEISRLDTGLTTEEYSIGVYNEVRAEFEALKNETDKFITNMKENIDKLGTVLIDEDLRLYRDALNRYRDAIARTFDMLNEEYVTQMNIDFNHMINIIDMILAYRFYADRANYKPEDAELIKVVSKVEGYTIMPLRMIYNVTTIKG